MKEIILNGHDTTVRLENYPDFLPDEKLISDFESALAYSLPNDDYKEFLLNYNGGMRTEKCNYVSIGIFV